MKPIGTPNVAIRPNEFFVEAIVDFATGANKLGRRAHSFYKHSRLTLSTMTGDSVSFHLMPGTFRFISFTCLLVGSYVKLGGSVK
jgi:hypothetical protein